MGGDSCFKGHGFKSQHCTLDGHYFTFICCKNCNDVCLKRPKINDKRGRGWPIFQKNCHFLPRHDAMTDPFIGASSVWQKMTKMK